MEDLNQLYSKALGAFSQAAGLTPQQSQMTSGMQGVAGRINQNPNIRGGMNPVGWTGTGIATIPQGGSTWDHGPRGKHNQHRRQYHLQWRWDQMHQ